MDARLLGRRSIAPSSLTPNRIAGLKIWLDAQDNSTLTLAGAAITQWNDKSGNGVTFTQATGAQRPTLTAASINGFQAAVFDRTASQNMRNAVASNLNGAQGECFFVIRTTSVTTASLVPLSSADEASATRFLIVGEILSNALWSVEQNDNVTNDVLRSSAVAVATTNYVVNVRSDGSVYAMDVNNVAQTLNVLSGSNSGDWWADTPDRDNIALGCLYFNGPIVSTPFDGAIGEVLVYDGVTLSTAQRLMVTRYLSSHWGIAI